MKTTQLINHDEPLQIVETNDPEIISGSVLVKVLAASIPSFSKSVVNGSLGYDIPKPFPVTLGTAAVGIVEQMATDVYDLEIGDLVLVDNYIYSKHPDANPDHILLGWTGLAEKSSRLQEQWKNGAWAEKLLCPRMNIHRLPKGSDVNVNKWVTLNYLSISYGALLRGNFKPGMSLILNGATGSLGSGIIHIALALGASNIIALGRNKKQLETIKNWDSKRITTISTNDISTEQLNHLLNEHKVLGFDLFIDAVGGATESDLTLAGIRSLKRRGSAVFVGSVLTDIPLPFMEILINEWEIKGSFMYDPEVPSHLVKLVSSGHLKLDVIQTNLYELEAINMALVEAETFKGLHFAVLEPNKDEL